MKIIKYKIKTLKENKKYFYITGLETFLTFYKTD